MDEPKSALPWSDRTHWVLAALPSDLAPAIEFASITGFRVGEIRSLTWAQVDLGHGILRLEPGTTKNEEGRTWPFRTHPRLSALLHEQQRRPETLQRRLVRIVPYVFWREDGRQIREFRDSWRRACREAGCPGRLVHDLRRSAERNLLRAEEGAEAVAPLSRGHSPARLMSIPGAAARFTA